MTKKISKIIILTVVSLIAICCPVYFFTVGLHKPWDDIGALFSFDVVLIDFAILLLLLKFFVSWAFSPDKENFIEYLKRQFNDRNI